MLTGLLQVDGRPLQDQRVLLISGDMTKLLGSTTTEQDGTFEVSVPSAHRHGKVILLVKAQGPVVALEHKALDIDREERQPQEFHINTAKGGFHELRSQVQTTSGWPPYLTIFVDPVHIEGIPEPLEKFFNQRDERVVESSFFKLRLNDKDFSLKLKSGTYRIGGDYLNYSRPNIVNPDFENYIVTRVEADGESRPLEGKRYSGYLFEVKRDRQVTMTIEVVPDKDLNPSGA